MSIHVDGYIFATSAIEGVGPVHPVSGGATAFTFSVFTTGGNVAEPRFESRADAEKARTALVAKIA